MQQLFRPLAEFLFSYLFPPITRTFDALLPLHTRSCPLEHSSILRPQQAFHPLQAKCSSCTPVFQPLTYGPTPTNSKYLASVGPPHPGSSLQARSRIATIQGEEGGSYDVANQSRMQRNCRSEKGGIQLWGTVEGRMVETLSVSLSFSPSKSKGGVESSGPLRGVSIEASDCLHW